MRSVQSLILSFSVRVYQKTIHQKVKRFRINISNLVAQLDLFGKLCKGNNAPAVETIEEVRAVSYFKYVQSNQCSYDLFTV